MRMKGLLYHAACPVCGHRLDKNEYCLCTRCRLEAPLTGLWLRHLNPMRSRLTGLLPVEHASALFWYGRSTRWNGVVHDFKYRHRWLEARRAGEWFGAMLDEGGLCRSAEVVVPVPLHWLRQVGRYYNQCDFIADGIARRLGLRVERNNVVRNVYRISQTATSSRYERLRNAQDLFVVRHPERLRGRHVLLVDDVFTTGSTIMDCADAILRATGGDVRFSIATIAATPLGLKPF